MDDDSQVNRRALVHAVSAYFEGCAHGIRQNTIRVDDDLRVLSDGERVILLELSYKLDNKGEVVVSDSFERFRNMLLFSLRTLAKAHGALQYKPDTSDHRWNSVQEFVKLRNRITHPKSADDLQCSKEDIDRLLEAFDWFHDTIRNIGKELGIVDEARDT